MIRRIPGARARLQAQILSLFTSADTALTGREIAAALGQPRGLQQALSDLERRRILCREPGVARTLTHSAHK